MPYLPRSRENEHDLKFMAWVAADPESNVARLRLLPPGQGLVLSHLNSQHVTVPGAWAEIGGSRGGVQASQTLAQTPPSCALGQSPPGVWFSCSVGGDIVAGSWRTEMIFEEQPSQYSAYRVVTQEGEEHIMVGAQ